MMPKVRCDPGASWPHSLAAPAQAETYPTRPVTIMVPFAAGGGSDLLARLVAQHLEGRLGKPFIIENRPGAGTTIAAMATVRAAPDGYTLMQATSSTMAINVTMHKKLPYEPLKDLVPVALYSSSPFFLVVQRGFADQVGEGLDRRSPRRSRTASTTAPAGPARCTI